MARTKKPVNYDEELMKIDAQITKWTNTISELKEKRKELEQQKRTSEINSLYDYLKSHNLSPEDLLAQIK